MTILKDLEVKLLLTRQKLRARIRKMRGLDNQITPYHVFPLKDTGRPQDGMAIVAIIKDEAPYLAEWIEFHLMLGIRHVYLYDNGSSDATPDVLAPYLRAGVVTLIPWHNFSRAVNPQILAYTHAIPNYVADYRWVAFIDLDEFLYPVEGNSLEEAFRQFAHLPAISVPWICFGPSGHKTQPAGLVIANYTERCGFPQTADQFSLLRYKTIANPREVVAAGNHSCTLRGLGNVFINERGEIFPAHLNHDLRYVVGEKLRFHHYFTRSEEEIQKKLLRGRAEDSGAVKMTMLDRRLAQYKTKIEKDTTIWRFLPELQARLAQRQGTGIAAE